MGQEQRRVVRAVPRVDHHLRDVDGPALGEDPAREDGARKGRAADRVHELEVVARDGLVHGDEPQHPVVVLAEIRVGLLGRPILRDRRDVVEAALAHVERPRGVEHRARESPEESRGPLDREGIVRQAHEVPLPRERLDLRKLLATEPEDRLAGRVVGGHGVEHGPDDRAVGVGLRGIRERAVADPGRPRLAREPDHLRPDGGELGRRARADLVGRDARGGRRARASVRTGRARAAPRPPRRGGPRPRGGRGTARARPALPPADAASRGRTAATAGSAAASSAAVSASSTRSTIPGSWRRAISVWKRETGRPFVRTSASSAEASRRPMPSKRPASDASRSASGAKSRASSGKIPAPIR